MKNYIYATAPPKILTRWWLRVKQTKSEITDQGIGASAELCVPWWAWGFELIHRMVFGKAELREN